MTLQNPLLARAKEDPCLYFRDGRRRIDMVLAYEDEDEVDEEAIFRREARATFEENLKKTGLQCELEDKMVRWNGIVSWCDRILC